MIADSPEQSARTRTLIVSGDVMGAKMAGPGIRYYHLSRVLSRYTDLTLAIVPQDRRALKSIQASLPGVKVVGYRIAEWDTLKEHIAGAEVALASPSTIGYMPQFLDFDGALVLDGYDPMLAEWVTHPKSDDVEQQVAEWSEYLAELYNQYLAADFIICASERQRFWWFGQLEVAGRINPLTIGRDNSLRDLVDIVPYGLPQDPPVHTRPMVKGVWPGIDEDDILLLWGGGLWPWLDSLTAVQAVERLQEDYPNLKLIFPGTIHPNRNVAISMPVRETATYQYIQEKDLLNKVAFFGEWVPYEDWQSVLLECDIALSLHHDTLETQLAFRSRMLEYFWAGLPLVATTGDATSELVARYKVGVVVDYEDVDGVGQAIRQILAGDTAFQAGFERARQDLTWEKAAEPLIRFCQNPRRAADRGAEGALGITHHERKIRELEHLVAAVRSGRFIRAMKQLDDMRIRWRNWRNRP
ncbi:MAG: glycosyltransferase [Chloroflexota bacterium]|nr:MAG: glycosyltransferase [Chloroflexota bacterium]